MKCSDCKNFRAVRETVKKGDGQGDGGTCKINNTACDPNDECKTGLFDKTGAV